MRFTRRTPLLLIGIVAAAGLLALAVWKLDRPGASSVLSRNGETARTEALPPSLSAECATLPVEDRGRAVRLGGGLCFSSAAPASEQPFVRLSPMEQASHFLNLEAGGRTVRIGLSDAAGGYISQVRLSGFGIPALEGRNLDKWSYGQGWQSTLRDRLHNLRYNPAHVGFSGYRSDRTQDGAGAPAYLAQDGNNEIAVRQMPVPLYQGGGKEYDFTEHEDLVPDDYPEDGGHSDQDTLAEPGRSQDDEIRSEFDYAAVYRNESPVFGIPAFRHDFAYAYLRPPGAISQFVSPPARDSAGAPVYKPDERMADLSPTEPGKQEAQPTDLSGMLPTYGLRVEPADFPYVFWRENGRWQSVASSPRGKDREKVADCRLVDDQPGYETVSPSASAYETKKGDSCRTEDGLMIVSSSQDPAQGVAIGLYVPKDDPLNSGQTAVVDRETMRVTSREDRRLQAFISTTGGMTTTRSVISGLRSPDSLAAEGLQDRFEAFTERVYVLFGTPEDIRAAVERFRSSGAAKTEGEE